MDYVKRALQEKWFYKEDKETIYINSSIPEAIKEAEQNARNAEQAASTAEQTVSDMAKQNKIVNFITLLGIGIPLIALVVAAFAIFPSLLSLVDSTNARIDGVWAQHHAVVVDYRGLKEKIEDIQEENRNLRGELAGLRLILSELLNEREDQLGTSEPTGGTP